jgi:hypothetical protein
LVRTGLIGKPLVPKRPNKENVNAALYDEFCKRAGEIRDLLELKNFSELDALFNYSYWDKAQN